MVDCQRALAHSRGQRICGYTAGLRLLGRHLGPRCTFRLRLQLAEATWQMSQCLGDSVSAQSHTIQILQIWRTWQMSHEQCLGDSVAAQIHTIQIVQIWRTWQMSHCLSVSVTRWLRRFTQSNGSTSAPRGEPQAFPTLAHVVGSWWLLHWLHAAAPAPVATASWPAPPGAPTTSADASGAAETGTVRTPSRGTAVNDRSSSSARTGTTCATHAQVLSASRNQNSFSQGARRTRRSA